MVVDSFAQELDVVFRIERQVAIEVYKRKILGRALARARGEGRGEILPEDILHVYRTIPQIPYVQTGRKEDGVYDDFFMPL